MFFTPWLDWWGNQNGSLSASLRRRLQWLTVTFRAQARLHPLLSFACSLTRFISVWRRRQKTGKGVFFVCWGCYLVSRSFSMYSQSHSGCGNQTMSSQVLLLHHPTPPWALAWPPPSSHGATEMDTRLFLLVPNVTHTYTGTHLPHGDDGYMCKRLSGRRRSVCAWLM